MVRYASIPNELGFIGEKKPIILLENVGVYVYVSAKS